MIGVECGVLNGTSVPEQFDRFIVLSPVGLITPRTVSYSSSLLPSNVIVFVSRLTIVNVPKLSNVNAPLVNVPSIVRSCIPVISRFPFTERISLPEAFPRVIPERRLSSPGVAEIVVVDGEAKGINVPELFARLIVLSVVGLITDNVVSKLFAIEPSKETLRVWVVVALLIFPPMIVIEPFE